MNDESNIEIDEKLVNDIKDELADPLKDAP